MTELEGRFEEYIRRGCPSPACVGVPPLADPPLVTGADDPEDLFADWVITAWEAALAEAPVVR